MPDWICSCPNACNCSEDIVLYLYTRQWPWVTHTVHLHESVMRNDMEQTKNPLTKRIIEWRLGDPRVIKGK
jgi:hypothetical protein